MAKAAAQRDPMSVMSGRTMPHNIEAEQALLGAILVNNEAFYRVSDFLRSDHFFEPLHRAIFDVMAGLIETNKVASPITLKTFLPPDLDVAGLSLPQYLARLAAEATTVLNAVDYGRAICDLAMRRELINIADDIRNAAFDSAVDCPPREQVEDAEQRLYEVAETSRFGSGFETFDAALTQAIDKAALAYQRDGKLSGLPTGLKDLDAKMGGLQPSDLIIIAGRPGMGKTSLATNIAFNVARAYEAPREGSSSTPEMSGGIVAFFSLEMSSEQLATRVIAEQSKISSSSIRRGDISENDFDALVQRRQEIRRIPLYIDSTGGLTIGQVAARARRLKRQRGLHLIVVDYIQLMQGTSHRVAPNRVREVTEITVGLKALAKELNVPIVALSQLSRQVENREEKRPQLSDLRESGSIEQDADVVLFVFRDEYYLKGQEPPAGTAARIAWAAELEASRGKAEIIIGKQRHGPTGTVILSFQGEFTRFSDLAAAHPLPYHPSP
ncbi:replicative DNA helicase [Bradyrhizobium diazoefficiens]|uniref:replicative DNA helicase n=1 Tax=Bradyrhizobium diazoefficiens TaxID=1355477 RepID=UPI0019093813|nr:replicative DNA helicase [Bradyrhizobium diazoefficiens]MBK3666439.1 replicative DNA helicase [Bradyrhizobium diazoefficiens]